MEPQPADRPLVHKTAALDQIFHSTPEPTTQPASAYTSIHTKPGPTPLSHKIDAPPNPHQQPAPFSGIHPLSTPKQPAEAVMKLHEQLCVKQRDLLTKLLAAQSADERATYAKSYADITASFALLPDLIR